LKDGVSKKDSCDQQALNPNWNKFNQKAQKIKYFGARRASDFHCTCCFFQAKG
jgi:hypothetical protein